MKKRPCPCVGAIVKDKRGRILVLYRLKHSRGLALPAGHINRGEQPKEALARKVYEETGLRVKMIACVLDGRIIRNSCSKGANKHRWYIYRVTEWSGKPRRREKKKHAFVKFMTVKQIREDYSANNDIDPAWQKIFKRLRTRGLS